MVHAKMRTADERPAILQNSAIIVMVPASFCMVSTRNGPSAALASRPGSEIVLEIVQPPEVCGPLFALEWEEALMAKGTVKWFSTVKGYGFIAPEGGSKDAFVHITAVERAGLTGLHEGQQVEYERVEDDRGRSSADNLRLLD